MSQNGLRSAIKKCSIGAGFSYSNRRDWQVIRHKFLRASGACRQ